MSEEGDIDYRGVARQDVIHSLRQGEALIRGLALGPAVEKQLDDWLARDPFTRISAARTRAELAHAMQETGSAVVFRRMEPIFLYHAAVNTEGSGIRIMQNLACWGAFSGIQDLHYFEQDEEQDRYLTREFVRAASAEPAVAVQRAETLISLLRHAESEEVGDYESTFKTVLKIMNKGTADAPAALVDAFDKADLAERHLMKTLLSVMSGAADAQSRLEIPTPINRYGVVFENLSRNFATMAKEIGDEARSRLENALDPFYQTDEVEMTGIGAITRDFKYSGLIFEASASAAEAVAAAFPERRVIDFAGREVEKPSFAPGESKPKIPAP